MVVKVVGHVALRCGPVSLRLAPVGRIGRATADVAGDRAFGEEVGRNTGGFVPVHDVNSTAVLVVLNAKVTRRSRGDTASLVASGTGSTVVSSVVLEGELALHVDIAWHGAAVGGVDGVSVKRVVVDTFDDVDLATVWPAAVGVRWGRPPCGPDTTANRHVLGVENKDAGGEGVLGGDTDGLSPAVAGGDLHLCLTVGGADEALVLGLVLTDVGDGTVGGVGGGEEVHVIEEGGASVRLDEFPSRGRGAVRR